MTRRTPKKRVPRTRYGTMRIGNTHDVSLKEIEDIVTGVAVMNPMVSAPIPSNRWVHAVDLPYTHCVFCAATPGRAHDETCLYRRAYRLVRNADPGPTIHGGLR